MLMCQEWAKGLTSPKSHGLTPPLMEVVVVVYFRISSYFSLMEAFI